MVSIIVTLLFHTVSQKWHDGLNSNVASLCGICICTCLSMRPREQLLQKYKAERHAVLVKDTLFIEDENLSKECRTVHSSVP